MTPKVLVFAGSTRKESLNKKVAKIAAEMLRSAGAEVTYLDLRDIPMPLYDGDLEASEGIPPNGRKFKDLLRAHEAFLIVSPEYNGAISGVLKNAIDWASRPAAGEKPLECFAGKVVGLCSASPGAFGGVRSALVLRGILGHINSIVLGAEVNVLRAHEAFDENDQFKSAYYKTALQKLVADLVAVTTKLKS
jgi:chromate reductase